MHLIPDTSHHLHMLVSVFPFVGLIFVLGFYVAGMITDNDVAKRFSLLAVAALGVLSIPTYFSGEASASAIAAGANFTQVTDDRIYYHAGWGWAALIMSGVTGATALGALGMYPSGRRISNDAMHLVLGLSLITIGLMIVTGELGWQVAHYELHQGVVQGAGPQLPSGSDIAEGQATSQNWSHTHMILNHFPTVGFVITLGFFVISLMTGNVVLQRASLVGFTICGVLGAPTYATGAAAMWALTQPELPDVTKPVIDAHRDFAMWTLFGLAATGVTSYLEVWRFRYKGVISQNTLFLVLGFAIITLGLMAETGHRGGFINHPEIRTYAMPTDSGDFLSPAIELLINNVIWFVPWQTVHFFGYSLVFGTVTAVALRILGFWKSVPFSAVHRFLPLGVFGVAANIFTGMLMLMADTFRYVNEITFVPKMFFLPIGAISVIYFSLSDKLWKVKAGEDAPMLAKWIAVLVVLSWIGVIMGGRLLPYL